jgi:hypothetical protein
MLMKDDDPMRARGADDERHIPAPGEGATRRIAIFLIAWTFAVFFSGVAVGLFVASR